MAARKRPIRLEPRDFLHHFPPQVWHYPGDMPVTVEPDRRKSGRARKLDGLPLIVAPGQKVRWRGRTYSLRREGRYVFLDGCKLLRQVIAYGRDDIAFFRALAQIQVHGHRHDDLSIEGKLTVAQTGHLSITCGNIAKVCMRLLADRGVCVRQVGLTTLEAWNAYDNGHCLFEYWSKRERQWVLVDLDAHALFRLDGRFLSAYEFHRAVVEERPYEIVSLGNIGKVDYLDIYQGRDFATYVEAVFHVEEALRRWYARVAQAVTVTVEGLPASVFPEDDPARIARIESYAKGYRCLTPQEWLAMFYRRRRTAPPRGR